MTIDPKALFIGMVFIANAGALMDLSMDVAISCEEIVYHRPDITRGALLKSGISIGRGVLGTQTTTLMLAYSGNYLSMLMYFAGQGTPVMDMLNLKYVSSQLMNTLVGSFGLVAVTPMTALAASVLYTRHAAGKLAAQHEEAAPALEDAPTPRCKQHLPRKSPLGAQCPQGGFFFLLSGATGDGQRGLWQYGAVVEGGGDKEVHVCMWQMRRVRADKANRCKNRWQFPLLWPAGVPDVLRRVLKRQMRRPSLGRGAQRAATVWRQRPKHALSRAAGIKARAIGRPSI